MTSAGAAVSSTSGCDSCHMRRRPDGLPARGNEEARLPDHRRRPHGPVRNPSQPRAHHQPGRLALRLPGLCRRCHAVGRPHRRPAGAGAVARGLAIRGAVGVAGVPRLRLHSRSAPAAARSPRTTSSAASTSPTATRRPSRPASCRSRGRLPPSAPQPSTSYVTTTRHRTVQEDSMKNEKKQDKKGTLRPWLVDVVVDNLR